MKFWPLVREIGVLRLIWMFQRWTLDIVLYDKLTFSDYFTHNIQKALGRLSGLNRFKSLQAYILSIFEYCYPAHRSSISRNYTGNPKIADHLHRLMFKLRRYNWVINSLWEEAHLLQMEAIYFVIYSPQGPCHRIASIPLWEASIPGGRCPPAQCSQDCSLIFPGSPLIIEEGVCFSFFSHNL